ncbi:MAG: PEP/pyruvate-binding domain-containing protein [Armatimonadetes bacterium]|nr:PEP/pyruvate-binding domain-containing protein [Armatimonadota bacterium]
MSPDDKLRALQERAKELECLYRVEEVLDPEIPLAEIAPRLVAIIPQGWQYPEICRCRVSVRGRTYALPSDPQQCPWVQSAVLRVHGQPVGELSVCYSEARPDADEGPFLKEERRLIQALAERIGKYLRQRELENWEKASEEGSWEVIRDFLRRSDPALLARLTRRLVTHLTWIGLNEEPVLAELAPRLRPPTEDENRLLGAPEAGQNPRLDALTDQVFELAAGHLGNTELLALIQTWVDEDKSRSLLDAVVNQEASLERLQSALMQFRRAVADETRLPQHVQTALRAGLLFRIFTDQADVIYRAKQFVSISDFHELMERIVHPPQSHGRLGGKSSGLFVARQIARSDGADEIGEVKVPLTWYITSDALLDFINYNNLENLHTLKYREFDQVRQAYPHIIENFKNSSFPASISRSLVVALEEFGTRPLIVRSSSLLEDRIGSSFAGKYRSIFLPNQGSKPVRLAALQDAIAEIYASVFGPDPIAYRRERGLLDFPEEMCIMIQAVVGARCGRYYMPAFSGVAFSRNEFRWSPRIRRQDGLVRLVPGLGTRAVDRLSDDYPVLIALGQPGLRVNASPDEVVRHAPRRMDVIDLSGGGFTTVEVEKVLRECGHDFPMIRELVSQVDQDMLRRPSALGLDFERHQYVFTFEGLVSQTPFIRRLAALMKLLEERLSHPVDIEFACDGSDFYLLQCRHQSDAGETASATIPQTLDPACVLFSARRYVSNGQVPEIRYIVYVDPAGYAELESEDALREVGRAVGALNKVLPARRFILMGPGRWGSRGDIRLGISVSYSDICDAALLVEMARTRGDYTPDLSFGTHFFQDLVEAGIRYLPLYPDEPGVLFNEPFFLGSTNRLGELLPAYAHLSRVLRVIDVSSENGKVLRVLMNADQDYAVGFLDSPHPSPPH